MALPCNQGLFELINSQACAHIATSFADSFEQGLGVYHLLDPLACLSFAQLILGFEHDVKVLSNIISTQAQGLVTSCGWSPYISRISARGNEFIEQWRLQVDAAIEIRSV